MGFLTSREPDYDMSVRQTGFNRYRQLLSLYGAHWFQVNLFTVLGALPLATGIALSLLTSSVLLLIPCSLLGGAIFGPFLAGMFDAVMRGLRDDPGNWWSNYRRSWRQNWRGSLIPGALLGLFTGMFAFMAALMWWAQVRPTPGTVALYLFAALVFFMLNTLYWPQLVLFRQTPLNRMRNIVLFTAKYLWRVAGAALMQMGYLLVMILFAPWTLLLVPFLGFWYILFLSQLYIYGRLDKELQIERSFAEAAGISIPADSELEE